MTNDELAELALYLRGLADQMDLESDAIPMNGQKLREAAQLIRDMPEGERIEGWVPNWPATNGVPRDEFVEIHFERETAVQGDLNVSPCTLTVHERKEES